MTNPIVAATDFSDRSAAALRAAARLATQEEAKLICINVMASTKTGSSWGNFLTNLDEMIMHARAEREARLRAFCDERLEEDITPKEMEFRVVEGRPAEAILGVAHKVDAQMVVIGSAGYGRLGAAFLGSTANDLVRQSERPVLIVPAHEAQADELHGSDPILVPLDFSPVSLATLEVATKMARRQKRRLILAHALGPSPVNLSTAGYPVSVSPDLLTQMLAAQRAGLHQVIKALDIEDLVEEVVVESGDAAPMIREIVEKHHVGVVCMGSHGRQGIRRFLLGNTAERVLREAPCPVLVIQRTLAPESPLRGAITLEPPAQHAHSEQE